MRKKKSILKLVIISIIALVIIVMTWIGISAYVTIKRATNNQTNNISSKCSRTIPYQNSPEFSRAISLILQRHEQYLKQKTGVDENSELPFRWGQDFQNITAEERGNYSFWQTLKQEQNCIKIDYMVNEDKDEAEAFFSFSTESTPQELNIQVSKKYQTKDDLLTSVLLSHELEHAVEFVTTYPSKKTTTKKDCFWSETIAFVRQHNYISMLNKEEKESLQLRINELSSPEIVSLNNLLGIVAGKTTAEIQKTIENEPYYQKQCQVYPN